MENSDSATVFDKEELLNRVEQDEDLAKETVDIFLQYVSEMVNNVQQHIGTGDFHNISRSVHELKGAAANIAAQQVTNSARRVKQAADNENLQQIYKEFETLQADIEDLKKTLSAVFPSDTGE